MPLQPVRISANETLSITDLISGFGSGLAILPLIIIVQAIAIAKSLGRKSNYKVDDFQEIIAVGLANVFASFFGGFSLSATFSRSAVNNLSGAATCFSGLYNVFR